MYFILFYCFNTKAQSNLVPNFSFEQVDSCPNYVNKIAFAQPWFSAYHSEVSTDLFDTCSQSFVGIPANIVGNQIPRSGKSYAGIIAYKETNYREYLETRLHLTLITGKQYCVTYHVSLSDSSRYAIEDLNLKFTQDSINIPGIFTDSLVLNVPPDILNQNSYLTDRVNWTGISGIYTAQGSENFITIGNFSTDANTNFIVAYPGNNYYQSYYYIDDVSVVEISPTSAGNDTTICAGETVTIGGLPTFEATYYWAALNGSGNMSIDSVTIAKPHVNPFVNTTYVMEKTQCNVVTYDTVMVNVNCIGLKEERELAEFSIYPNPASESLRVNYKGDVSIKITDVLGKEVIHVEGSDHEIDVSGMSDGIYFVSLVNAEKKVVATKKFVVQH